MTSSPVERLRRHTVGLLLGTQLASTIGSTTTGFAFALWLYGETGSVTWLGALFVANTLPGTLLGPWAGTIVDRHPRRTVMLAADAAAAVATLGLVLALLAGTAGPVLIVVAGLVISSASAFQEPAYGAAVATVAPPERLERINGIVQLGPAAGTVAGPALAAGLLVLGGLPLVLLVDLVTFTVATCTLAVLRFDGDVEATDSAVPGRQALREGWRFLMRSPGLRTLAFTATGLNLLFGFVNVLLIPLVVGFADEASAGVILSVSGAGLLVGSLARAAAPGLGRPSRVIAVSTLAIGLGILVTAARPSLLLVGVGVALMCIPVPIVSATAQAIRQRVVPKQLLGRVLALQRAIVTAALPLAHLSAGPLTDGVFEPAMAEDGGLASSLGSLVGTGPGRGAAALFVLCGIGIVGMAVHLGLHRDLRQLADGDDGAVPAPRALPGQPTAGATTAA